MGYSARIIADTTSECHSRLVTFELTLPKWIQAEFNTHRLISRNSASSRAIPVKKMLDRIKADPVIPVFWGKNQSGMSAYEELDEEKKGIAENIWRLAGSVAMGAVESLLEVGLHKQIANRILEPWMFTTIIASATEWDHLFALRDHPHAQPEFAKVAGIMHELYKTNKSRLVGPDENRWHTPYVDGQEWWKLRGEGMSVKDILMVSAGRCARVSYLTHDGVRDPKADVELCQRLIKDGHMSPLEHVARSCSMTEWANLDVGRQWSIYRVPTGNFWGWQQLRKVLKNEHNFSLGVEDLPEAKLFVA